MQYPNVLDRIKVRGVRRVGLERNRITFKERQHEICSVDFGVILLEKRISDDCPYFLEDWEQPAT